MSDFQRFQQLLKVAQNHDAQSPQAAQETIDHYTACISSGLSAAKQMKAQYPEKYKQILRLLDHTTKRAEELKSILTLQRLDNITIPKSPQHFKNTTPVAHQQAPKPAPVAVPNKSSGKVCNFTRDEMKLLQEVSKVNGQIFPPYLDEDLKLEKFKLPSPYEDSTPFRPSDSMKKMGSVKLVSIQQVQEEPEIFNQYLGAGLFKQGSIGDCSLICSMAVSADYEFRRFPKGSPNHVPLLTRIIYPSDAARTDGKYLIVLYFNGCRRKVVIDDRIPIHSPGGMYQPRILTCTAKYDRNKCLFLPALIEKAYMKMMGGYDFPGSNSGVDMHTLFGWIPERVDFTPGATISVGTNGKKYDAGSWYDQMLMARFHSGHCLVTISTPPTIPAEYNKLGLEDGHAYAVLDIRKTSNGLRMMKVKNPWAKDRFKGRWSPYDTKNWTAQLQKELGYDTERAKQKDDGIFWLDYDAARYCFDNLWLAWRPDLLFDINSRFEVHAKWNNSGAPVKDRYFLTKNPQYKLTVTGSRKLLDSAPVWILLTRHITSRRDFEENSVYLGLMVFAGGKRIYSKSIVKPPVYDGIRINSPHYLVKLNTKEMMKMNDQYHEAVLVITQYENRGSSSYTLTSYVPQGLRAKMESLPGPDDFKFTKKLEGKWTAETAGGCMNFPSYSNNPVIKFKLHHNEPTVIIQLKAPRECSVGFMVKPVEAPNFSKRDTGDYHHGFTHMQLGSMDAGVYSIIPTTFHPGKAVPFWLEFSSNAAGVEFVK